MQTSNRQQVVSELIHLSRDIESLSQDLKKIGWNSNEPPTALTREIISNILDRFLSGQLSAKQLEDWANLIEGREDVEFDPSNEKVIADAIFLLANPEINFPIDAALAQKIKQELRCSAA